MTQTTTTTTDTPINADDARSNQEGEGERESSNGGIPNIRKYLCPNAVAYLNHLLSSTAFLILNSKPLLKGKTNGFFILCPKNELARVVCNHHSEFLRIWYLILPDMVNQHHIYNYLLQRYVLQYLAACLPAPGSP